MADASTVGQGSGLNPAARYTLRGHRPGDIGWVIHRQAVIYAQEYGFDISFEALLAEIGAKFIQDFDPAWERCWVAEREGAIVGAVFVVKVSEQVAKLRMLYVEASERGQGLGRYLTAQCIGFARDKGYDTLTLWTNAQLSAALRIYQAAGFELVSEERHHSFGQDQVGQIWELRLRP